MKKFWVSTLALLLSLSLCVSLLPAAFAGQDETYLISITTADGVVTSGYRDEWRWVALGRADPGRPGILLRGNDANVTGSLRRSDGLPVGDDLDAWGKAQDGKPATLTLGKESWECTVRYKDYGYQSVLYAEFLRDEKSGYYIQPDSDTIDLFRYDWAQEETARCAGILDGLLHADGYVVDKQLATPSSTVVLRHREVPATGGEVAYQDYELCLIRKRAYTSDPVHRLLLPSTTLVGDYAPTDCVPDSITLDHSGRTLTYVYSFDSPLSRPDGEVLHEAGTYTYVVDTGTGELTASHGDSPWAARVDPQAEYLAWRLKNLDLFLGNENGDFELDRAPSRVEALVMLIRALGEEPQAKAAGKTHPFTDVPAWADGYVSWGYAKGYTNGISGTQFGADLIAGSDMYLTFMLRALGYSDKEGDFTWSSPWLAARTAGILPFETNCVNFTRSDAVLVTSAALFAQEKGQSQTLHERLEAAGAFSAEFFNALFSDEPFAWQTTVERKVNEALDKALEVGQADRRTARVQSHAILDVAQDGALFTVSAMVCRYYVTDETLKAGDYGGYGFSPYVVEIQKAQASPGTVLRCEMDGGRDIWDDPQAQLFREDLVPAAQQKLTDLIASGTVQFRAPTYDEAVAELRGGFGYHNERLFDTDICTVVVRDYGGMMHAQKGCITVVYKSGSAKGAGEVVYLPTLSGKARYDTLAPHTLSLNEEKTVLTYAYQFDENQYAMFPTGRTYLNHPAGTYTYTVDLATGEVTDTFVPKE